jgi:UDP:flavonoid glycosyltransferase YjiC (YdhE family)
MEWAAARCRHPYMRILFATTRGAGHVGPLVPVAHACASAGHGVLVAGPAAAAPAVLRAGLPFAALGEPPAAESAAAWAPVWSRSTSPGAEHVIRELFIGLSARAALPDMLHLVATVRPDVIVRETCEFASVIAAERYGVPQLQVGVHLDTAIDASELFMAVAAPALDDLRRAAGVAADPACESLRGVPLISRSPASLADPAAEEPARLTRFRVPADPPPSGDTAGVPLVYVSFGSEAATSPEHFPDLYRSTALALAELPVRVLMTIGDRRDPAALGALPDSVRIERWVPQADVMGRAAAMVGHGGSGSTLAALAAGVPLALVPLFVDGPRNAARVAAAGAGIAVGDGAAGLSAAVAALLDGRRHRRAAQAIAAEIAALPLVDDVVDDLLAAVA